MADVPKKQDAPAQEGIELKSVVKPAAVVQAQPKTPTTLTQGSDQDYFVDLDTLVGAEKQLRKNSTDNINDTAAATAAAVPTQAPAAPESVASNVGLKEPHVLTTPADQDNESRHEEDYIAFMRRERHAEYRKRPWKLLRPLKERIVRKTRAAAQTTARSATGLANYIKANKPLWWTRAYLIPIIISLLCVLLTMSVTGLVATTYMMKHGGNSDLSASDPSIDPAPRDFSVMSLAAEIHGDYLEETSDIFEEHTVINLFKKSIVTSATASDIREDDNLATAMAVASVMANATSTSIFPVSFNTSGIQSMSMADASPAPVVTPFLMSTVSFVTTVPTLSSSEQCGETGNGAGPCTRPYGWPNSTPASTLQSSAIAMSLNDSAYSAADALSASLLPSAADGTCHPTATVVITVTVPVLSAWTANATTIHVRTSTALTLVTSTLSLVETETVVPLGNMSSSTTTSAPSALTTTLSNGNTATLSIANFTLTLGMPNGSSLSSTSRTNPASATSTIVITNDAGDRFAPPKPLGTSGSGSGVYCTVMLVALLALLL